MTYYEQNDHERPPKNHQQPAPRGRAGNSATVGSQDEKLAIRIASLALSYLSDVDAEEIAETLHYELEEMP